MFNQVSYRASHAASKGDQYIESIQMFSASSKEKAIEKCAEAGYQPVDSDLNTGNDGNAVVMGYRTTADPGEAITDISVLEMNSGYKECDYGEIAEKEMEMSGNIVFPFMNAVWEYQDNLKKNSPGALAARKILNSYFIPEMENIGFGDYLASDKCTEDYVKKIVCQANTGIMYAMFGSMASGVSDFGHESWAQRIYTSEVREQLNDEKNYRQLDQNYMDSAEDMIKPLQEFYTECSAALEFVKNEGVEAVVEGNDADEEFEVSEEAAEAVTEGRPVEEDKAYAEYLAAYEILEQYPYSDDQNLAEYIMDLGGRSYTANEDRRCIYPLIDAMTYGQFGVFRITGITSMAISLTNDERLIQKTDELIKEIFDTYKADSGKSADRISIWTGVDRSIYDKKVALTSLARIQTQAGEDFSALTKEDSFDRNAELVMAKLGVAAKIAGIATFGVLLAVNAATVYSSGFLALLNGALVLDAITACYTAAFITTGCMLMHIAAFLGLVIAVSGTVIMVMMIAIMIIQLARWIVSLFEEDADALEYTLNDIPLVVYDSRGGSLGYMKYCAAMDADRNLAADMNAGEGRRFSALYYSKNSKLGEPLKVNPDGDTFKVVRNDTHAPEGYSSVRYFGPGDAANLNAYSEDKSAPDIYLSYYSGSGQTEASSEEDSTQNTSEEPAAGGADENTENEGTEAVRTGKHYLKALYVSVQKTETAAKAELKKMGDTPIDRNLTEYLTSEAGMYTYLGYMTTDIVKDAIKDIRILPGTTDDLDSFRYGESNYSRAGVPTAAGTGIFFTTSENAGTPIYDDLQITANRADAVKGYEPVNLFSGGTAYNLNECEVADPSSNWYGLYFNHWNKNCVYIYFHPEKMYTSGTEYVGGMAFFTGRDTKHIEGNDVENYALETGYMPLTDYDFTKGFEAKFLKYVGTSLGTSTKTFTRGQFITYAAFTSTYNPYRAIYGVKSYSSQPGTGSLSPGITVRISEEHAAGYAACGVYCQYDGDISIDVSSKDTQYRGMSRTNSYSGAVNTSPRSVPEDTSPEEKEDFESVEWNTSKARLKNLYVVGRTEGMDPIVSGSISLTNKTDDSGKLKKDGCVYVQDVKTPNRTGQHNLSFSSAYPVYMIVPGAEPVEKKYIASVSVNSWNLKKAIGNDKLYDEMRNDQKKNCNREADDSCIAGLLATSSDEIIQKNLAVSYKDSKQSNPDNVPSQCAYIGVSRTDDPSKAVHSIIKFRPASADEAAAEIHVGGYTYTRAEGPKEAIHSPEGDYYLYYSTGYGCAPAEPITSIDFDSVPLVKDAATALTAVKTDERGRTAGDGTRIEGTQAVLKGYDDETNFIHAEFDSRKTYICDIFVGEGSSERNAMLDLLNMGCSMFLPVDLNKGADGRYILAGYDRYYSENGSTDYAVRDIVCTVGHSASETIEISGAEYRRARDRYIMNGDTDKAVSFNEGSGGYSIYLYYTYRTPYSTDSPVMNLAVSEKDYIPANDSDGKQADNFMWESVMTTSGRRCNFNDGVWASDNGYSMDTRLYMYLNRQDNSVREGALALSGSRENRMKYGVLSMGS